MSGQRGCLYVCATPLGNLEDITLRALRILREADRIAAEDTRRTRVLLQHHGIRTPLFSCHEHNEEECARRVVEWVRAGERVVLVCDAGTPGVADPGSRVVRAVAEAGLPVLPVPGPSAVTAALSVSGFPADAYLFLGFLPRRRSERERAIERIGLEELPVVLYEASHRVEGLLDELARALPGRPIFIAREMTKRFEEYLWGTAAELRARIAPARGEFVIVVGPQAGGHGEASPRALPLREEVELLVAHGLDEREAIRRVARAHGLTRQAVYRVVRGEPGRPD